MARLKIYAVAESRDAYLSQAVADLVGTGPHCQGSFYIGAHTKAAAVERLAELGMRFRPGQLRVVVAYRNLRDVAALIHLPGDFAAWRATGIYDAPIARIVRGQTEPVIAAHWRRDPDGIGGVAVRFLSEENQA